MTTIRTVAATKAEKLAALELERREILELYRSLSRAEWERMTLCTLWTVRDLLAHLITNEYLLKGVRTSVISGFNADRANQRLIAGLKRRSSEQLLDQWARRVVPKGLPAWMPDAYLADDWVHHQDVRWPLGRPRQQDSARLRLVLSALARSNKKRLMGLRLVADDLGWEYGLPTHPQVTGSAEALAMGIANRPAARSRLEGSGIDQLFS